jgi:hypothetical protein
MEVLAMHGAARGSDLHGFGTTAVDLNDENRRSETDQNEEQPHTIAKKRQ